MQGQKGKCKDDIKSYSLDRFKQVERSKTPNLSIFSTDVGLRRTCAYYRTSARAMCVRKGFLNCECVVGAYGQIFEVRFVIALFTLDDMGADHSMYYMLPI